MRCQCRKKVQKEEKLEEFRSFRTSKRRKQRKEQKAMKKKMLKLRIVLCVRTTQMRNKATKFAIETDEKTFS